MRLTQNAFTAAPFPIAALALAWRCLETAHRDRERRLVGAAGGGFKPDDLRASRAAAIDADTDAEAQVMLARDIVRAPARDLGDVAHKLAALRDYVGQALTFAEDEDLLSSAMRDLERIGGVWQTA
jgi:hypothetical protein